LGSRGWEGVGAGGPAGNPGGPNEGPSTPQRARISGFPGQGFPSPKWANSGRGGLAGAWGTNRGHG